MSPEFLWLNFVLLTGDEWFSSIFLLLTVVLTVIWGFFFTALTILMSLAVVASLGSVQCVVISTLVFLLLKGSPNGSIAHVQKLALIIFCFCSG